MKNQEIKLIAEFDGYFVQCRNAKTYWVRPTSGGEFKRMSTLNYDKDWNQLMRVVNKINFIAPVDVKEINNEGLYIFEIGSIFAPIEDVYKAVVEFLEWHNKNKKLLDERGI